MASHQPRFTSRAIYRNPSGQSFAITVTSDTQKGIDTYIRDLQLFIEVVPDQPRPDDDNFSGWAVSPVQKHDTAGEFFRGGYGG